MPLAARDRSSRISSATPTKERRARIGTGQTHHFALAVRDDETQLEWRETLARAGLRVSPVMDRVYFKSIYTNDPDGHIVELATIGPGFASDEPVETLGQALKLPPWLERDRRAIEARLRPVTAPPWPQAAEASDGPASAQRRGRTTASRFVWLARRSAPDGRSAFFCTGVVRRRRASSS